MRKYWDTVINSTGSDKGAPVSGALVYVRDNGTNDLVQLYSDDGVTPTGNPVTTNSLGYYEFYVADGTYKLEVSYSDVIQVTIPDVPIVDFENLSRAAATRDALAALDSSVVKSVTLMESGREGVFIWNSANLSSQVTLDTLRGIYVAPASDPTGASGAWVREGASYADISWFGAVNGGDIAAAWNAAVAMQRTVVVNGGGPYYGIGLTSGVAGQHFLLLGNVHIYKNANGTLWAPTHGFLKITGGAFHGDNYTGDNIVHSGGDLTLNQVSSDHAAGRALKATGAHTTILGGLYQTNDATASGYDIELGVSGTFTSYHQLIGVRTSQSTGGVLFIDCGGHCMQGGQIGKLTVQSGTSPVGSNSGQYTGVRIIGNVSLAISNGTFSSCEFAGATITLQSGITGISIDGSNVLSGSTTIVNNSGNVNHFLVQNAYSSGQMRWRIGASSSLAEFGVDVATGTWNFAGILTVPNTKNVGVLQTGGSLGAYLSCDASNNGSLNLGSTTAFGNITFGTGGLYVSPSGTATYQYTSTAFRPVNDNAVDLGDTTHRFRAGHIADLHAYPSASKTPTINGEMTFELTSNTQLTIKVKGSDGTVRSNTLTLA